MNHIIRKRLLCILKFLCAQSGGFRIYIFFSPTLCLLDGLLLCKFTSGRELFQLRSRCWTFDVIRKLSNPF